MTKLTGITWSHSRGILPVQATAQRYMELHPGVEIHWEARSLKAFGGEPVDKLAQQYDMIILDHPWMGYADRHHLLTPLEEVLEEKYLEDQRLHSVGKSYESYCCSARQYALAIDAAAPIAFYSPAKLRALGGKVPGTWDEVMDLARRKGVICAGNGTSVLMQFYMLCATKTDRMFTEGSIAPREIMKESLEEMAELFSYLQKGVFGMNPIAIYEMLASGEGREAYCPFDFGYSNYSRRGYGRERVIAADVASYRGRMLKTVLGGAGFAISASAKDKKLAADYLQFTACGEMQRTIYVQNGGQPGHRDAWLDDEANEITLGFFRNTLKTLDHAYLRPRYDGYLGFQEEAGPLIVRWLAEGGKAEALLDVLEHRYCKSVNNKTVNK